MRSRTWIAAAAVVASLMVGGCGAKELAQTPATNSNGNKTSSSSLPTSQMVGTEAPDFSLPTLNGTGTVSLKQLLVKSPVVLNAWASWCPPCQQETPDMVKLAAKFKSKITFVGVNMTSADTLSDARKFVSQYKIPYLTLADTKSVFQDAYGIIGYPVTVVVAQNGTIVAEHSGEVSSAELTAMIEKAVKA